MPWKEYWIFLGSLRTNVVIQWDNNIYRSSFSFLTTLLCYKLKRIYETGNATCFSCALWSALWNFHWFILTSTMSGLLSGYAFNFEENCSLTCLSSNEEFVTSHFARKNIQKWVFKLKLCLKLTEMTSKQNKPESIVGKKAISAGQYFNIQTEMIIMIFFYVKSCQIS